MVTSGSRSEAAQVQIVRTTPSVAPERLFAHRRCYMGISLDNPVFRGESLRDLVAWALAHFDHCLIIVGDTLRRFNETMRHGLAEAEATAAAEELGREFLDGAGAWLEGFAPDRLTVLRWRACLELPEFPAARQMLDRLYAADAAFRAGVQRDAHAFIKRQKRHGRPFAVDEERALALSCNYLLEEIAVFSVLSQRGWTVELYPGPELGVLVDIARGCFDGIPVGLKQRINVELRHRKG